MSELLQHLFQSRSRTAALRLLLQDEWSGSVSELARRAGLTPRAMAVEVRRLESLGLVKVTAMGGADQVHANPDHPAAGPLKALLEVASAPRRSPEGPVRESLVAWGAPLSVPAARSPLSLEETVVEGLVLARQDASVLRALPVVVVRNEGVLDWAALKERARRRKVGSELGMLLELTADLSGHPALKGQLEGLRDRRRKVARFYPETSSRFEAALARERSPRAARRWGFLMNMTEETFRATLEKHLA